MPAHSTRVLTACLVALLASSTCGSIAPTSPQGGPVAPNESIVRAELTGVAIIDSTTIGVEPPQRLAELTMRVIEVRSSANLLPAVEPDTKTLRVYSREPDQFQGLGGKTITAAVRLRGDGRNQRLWVTRLIEPTAR